MITTGQCIFLTLSISTLVGIIVHFIAEKQGFLEGYKVGRMTRK
jgi:hypothetical protein